MLDSDLAELYGVMTGVLNQAVKRNIERFPENFMFQLNESDILLSQSVTSSWGGRRKLPYAFTEQGVAMLSGVLRSETAVKISIRIIEAFIEMRHFIASNAEIFQRLGKVELKQIQHSNQIESLFKAIEKKGIKPTTGIFFESQLFDAHKLISEIIESTETSIILIDNYIDYSTLTLFSDRSPDIEVTIYTRKISEKLKLDLKKHNAQLPRNQDQRISALS